MILLATPFLKYPVFTQITSIFFHPSFSQYLNFGLCILISYPLFHSCTKAQLSIFDQRHQRIETASREEKSCFAGKLLILSQETGTKREAAFNFELLGTHNLLTVCHDDLGCVIRCHIRRI